MRKKQSMQHVERPSIKPMKHGYRMDTWRRRKQIHYIIK